MAIRHTSQRENPRAHLKRRGLNSLPKTRPGNKRAVKAICMQEYCSALRHTVACTTESVIDIKGKFGKHTMDGMLQAISPVLGKPTVAYLRPKKVRLEELFRGVGHAGHPPVGRGHKLGHPALCIRPRARGRGQAASATACDISSDESACMSLQFATTLKIDRALLRKHLMVLKWQQLSQKGDIPIPRSSHSITVVGDIAYVFGGEHVPRCTICFASMLQPIKFMLCWAGIRRRSRFCKLLLMTRTLCRTPIDSVVTAYDLKTYHWTKIEATGSTPTPRVGHTAARVGNAFYIFGGRSGESFLNSS